METFTKEQLMAAVQYAMEHQQAEDYLRVGNIEELWNSPLTAQVLDQLTSIIAPVELLTFEEIQQHINELDVPGTESYTADKLLELINDLLAGGLHNDFDLLNRRMELLKYGNIIQQHKK